MSDINRMLDDLLDTQPHRSDLRQNIVEAFESLSAQLAEERKHADELAYLLSVYRNASEHSSWIPVTTQTRCEGALEVHTERRKP